MDKQVKQRIEQLNNGEIPKGYKKTDFGVFPCDWVTDETLGDLFDFYGGLSKSRDELGEEGYAYLHYGDLHRGTFNTVSIDHYEQLPKCDISLTGKEKCLMKDGDVAFLDASEDLEGTSRAVLIDNPENKPFIAGLHIIYGKAKNNSLDKWFKQYITSSESVKKQFQRLAVGFKVYGVNRDTIPRIKVAFPSSNKEQSRIAEILMKWDKAIELYDKQIDALTRYKAVCLRKMFPAKEQNVPEWRFKGFSGDWEQYKFGELIKETRNKTTIEDEDTLLSCAIDGMFLNSELFFHFRGSSNIGYIKIKKYDLILSAQNLHLGNCNVNLRFEHGIISPAYKVFELVECNPLFIQAWVKQDSTKDFFLKSSTEGASACRKNIVWKDLFNQKVPVPNIEEQEKIGCFFNNIDNHINLHKQKCKILKRQRNALQQYLLNGIIRV